jgi:hypothetical protein
MQLSVPGLMHASVWVTAWLLPTSLPAFTTRWNPSYRRHLSHSVVAEMVKSPWPAVNL